MPFTPDDICLHFFVALKTNVIKSPCMAKSRNMLRRKIAQAEFEIMEVIWDLGEATVTEAMEALNKRRKQPVARGTVQVQLRRLTSKKWLRQWKLGGKQVFSPTCDRTEATADIASEITRRVFDGSCADLVRCLYQEDKLSSEEIQRLHELVDQMNSDRDSNA